MTTTDSIEDSTRVNTPMSTEIKMENVNNVNNVNNVIGKEVVQGDPLDSDLIEEEDHVSILDIEHLPVIDDPRLWTRRRKSCILATIALCSLSGTITANIYFPALDSLKQDLNASNNQIAASVSLFILAQGAVPMFWSGLSEIKGRRIPYIASITIYIIGTIVCSRANSIELFIVMRVLQAAGSSAVLALGAGTLSDIYDVEERGFKLGLYYGVPLLGPSLGSLIGGVITSLSSWRGTFYFLLCYGVICLLTMIWLPETFRKERSHAYRLALERSRKATKADLPSKEDATLETIVTPSRLELGTTAIPIISRIRTTLSMKMGSSSEEEKLKIHFRDVNPFAAVGLVLRQKHNFLAVLYSGTLFASQYSVSYSASLTFAASPYNFTALYIGLVLLAFGLGNIIGSLAGGKYSDIVLRKLKIRNGGVSEPEMRIKSTYIAMYFVPPFFIAYAWLVQKEVPIYFPVMALFVIGISTIWIYASTLAYIVDANPGRTTSAVACNSLFRGVLAAISAQVAEPAISAIGNGFYYTIFAFVLLLGQVGLILVSWRGKGWREGYRLKEEKAIAEANAEETKN